MFSEYSELPENISEMFTILIFVGADFIVRLDLLLTRAYCRSIFSHLSASSVSWSRIIRGVQLSAGN